MDLEHQFVNCSKKFILDGTVTKPSPIHDPNCNHCESVKNTDIMFNKQLGLVFYYGNFEKIQDPNPITIKTCSTTGKNITAIYNNSFSFLNSLYGNHGAKITEIVKEMMSFNWLPHEFIPKDDPAIKYYTHQLTYTYLDKPLHPQVSDHYRRELGWEVLRIKNDIDKFKESLDHMKKTLSKAPPKN